MKFVLKAAAAAGVLALASTGAMAQSASGTVNVTATVIATCLINTTASAGLLATADFSNPAAATGASLIKTTAYVNANIGTGDCNTPTHLTVSSANGGATSLTAVAGGGYAANFDYTAVATYDTLTTTLNTATVATFTGPESATSGPNAAPSTGPIGITITPNGAPKLAVGTYNDVLTVTLTAN